MSLGRDPDTITHCTFYSSLPTISVLAFSSFPSSRVFLETVNDVAVNRPQTAIERMVVLKKQKNKKTNERRFRNYHPSGCEYACRGYDVQKINFKCYGKGLKVKKRKSKATNNGLLDILKLLQTKYGFSAS